MSLVLCNIYFNFLVRSILVFAFLVVSSACSQNAIEQPKKETASSSQGDDSIVREEQTKIETIMITGIVKRKNTCGALLDSNSSNCSGVSPMEFDLTLIESQSKKRYKISSNKEGLFKAELPIGQFIVQQHTLFSITPKLIQVSNQHKEFEFLFEAKLR